MLIQNTDELSRFSPPDCILFSKVLHAYNAKQTEEYQQLFAALTAKQQADFIKYKAIKDRQAKELQPALTPAYQANKAPEAPSVADKDAENRPDNPTENRPDNPTENRPDNPTENRPDNPNKKGSGCRIS